MWFFLILMYFYVEILKNHSTCSLYKSSDFSLFTPSHYFQFFIQILFWTLFPMYTSHSRRMPVILMLLPETAPEISSHKFHTEFFFILHYHAKFPDQAEVLQINHAKPPDRTFPSSQQEMGSSVQIPYSKFPFFLSCFCILSKYFRWFFSWWYSLPYSVATQESLRRFSSFHLIILRQNMHT